MEDLLHFTAANKTILTKKYQQVHASAERVRVITVYYLSYKMRTRHFRIFLSCPRSFLQAEHPGVGVCGCLFWLM